MVAIAASARASATAKPAPSVVATPLRLASTGMVRAIPKIRSSVSPNGCSGLYLPYLFAWYGRAPQILPYSQKVTVSTQKMPFSSMSSWPKTTDIR